MNPRQLILDILERKKTCRHGVLNPVSSVTREQMEMTHSFFPEAHYQAQKMFELSRANHEILGFDAIMPVFSVVIESFALGCQVEWGTPEMMPRIRGKLWKNYADINIDPGFMENQAIKELLKCLAMLKSQYNGVAITGKVFGPWTLGYHLFGVEEFLVKTVLAPQEVKDILGKLSQVTVRFAAAQVEAGADIITVADHATRDLCSPESYRDFLMPIHKQLVQEIKVPIMLHICGNTADRIKYIAETGVSSFHFESKVDACQAVKAAEGKMALIGNVNNPSTLLFGTTQDVKREVNHALECGVGIIGPECAVPLNTPLENLKEITRAVRQYDKLKNLKSRISFDEEAVKNLKKLEMEE